MSSSAPVQDIEVRIINSTSVQVSWTPITPPETTGYRVVYSPTGYPCEKEVTVSGPPAVVTGLSPGQSYQFQVQALVEVDGETLEGERSVTLTAFDESEDGRLQSLCFLGSLGIWYLASCVLPWLLVTEDSDSVSTGVLAGAIVATSLLHTAILVGVVTVTCLWMRRKRFVAVLSLQHLVLTSIPLM